MNHRHLESRFLGRYAAIAIVFAWGFCLWSRNLNGEIPSHPQVIRVIEAFQSLDFKAIPGLEIEIIHKTGRSWGQIFYEQIPYFSIPTHSKTLGSLPNDMTTISVNAEFVPSLSDSFWEERGLTKALKEESGFENFLNAQWTENLEFHRKLSKNALKSRNDRRFAISAGGPLFNEFSAGPGARAFLGDGDGSGYGAASSKRIGGMLQCGGLVIWIQWKSRANQAWVDEVGRVEKADPAKGREMRGARVAQEYAQGMREVRAFIDGLYNALCSKQACGCGETPHETLKTDPSFAGPATDVKVHVVFQADQESAIAGAQADFGEGISLLEGPKPVAVHLGTALNLIQRWDLECYLRIAPSARLGERDVTIRFPDKKQERTKFTVKPLVFVIDIDGLRPDILSMALKNEAPNISRALGEVRLDDHNMGQLRLREYQHGSFLKDALSVFPSYTFPTQASLCTGTVPGVHRIGANEYLDRSAKLGTVRTFGFTGDYSSGTGAGDAPNVYTQQLASRVLQAPTIHEAMAGRDGIGHSLVGQHQFRNGVADKDWLKPDNIDFLLYYFNMTTPQYDISMMNKVREYLFSLVNPRIQPPASWPSIVWLYFASLDHFSHGNYDSEENNQIFILRKIDTQLKDVFEWAQKYCPGAVFILISDHGQTDVRNGKCIQFDHIARMAENVPLVIPDDMRLWWHTHQYLSQTNVVFSPNSGSAYFYLKGPGNETDGWMVPPTWEHVYSRARWIQHFNPKNMLAPAAPVLSGLGLSPYFDLILVRDAAREGWNAPYRVLQEDGQAVDLAGFLKDSSLLKRWGWEATEEDARLVARLLNEQSSEQSGDVVVLPRYPDYYFGYGNLAGEHGSILKTDMSVPFVVFQLQARGASQINWILDNKGIRDKAHPSITDLASTAAAFCGQTWRGQTMRVQDRSRKTMAEKPDLKAAKTETGESSDIGLIQATIALSQGNDREARALAERILKVNPNQEEAKSIFSNATIHLAPIEIKNLIDQYIRGLKTNQLVEFYRIHAVSAFSVQFKHDLEAMIGGYSQIQATAMNIDVDFLEKRHPVYKAQATFSHIITGLSTQKGIRKVLFEGESIWKLEKKGMDWIIAEISYKKSLIPSGYE